MPVDGMDMRNGFTHAEPSQFAPLEISEPDYEAIARMSAAVKVLALERVTHELKEAATQYLVRQFRRLD